LGGAEAVGHLNCMRNTLLGFRMPSNYKGVEVYVGFIDRAEMAFDTCGEADFDKYMNTGCLC